MKTKPIFKAYTAFLFGLLFLAGLGLLTGTKAKAATVINSVEIYDIDLPQPGKEPDYTAAVPDSAPYHLATDSELFVYNFMFDPFSSV